MRQATRKPNRQKTATKRRAVESLAGRIVKQQQEWGMALPDSVAAQKRAVAIAEKSDRDRDQRTARKPKRTSPLIVEPSTSGTIVSRAATKEYRDNWDRIFGNEN